MFRFDGSVNYINCEDFELDVSDIERIAALFKVNPSNSIINRIYSYTGGWKSLVCLNLK